MIIVIRKEIEMIIEKRTYEIENIGIKIGHQDIQVAANHIPILDQGGPHTKQICLPLNDDVKVSLLFKVRLYNDYIRLHMIANEMSKM